MNERVAAKLTALRQEYGCTRDELASELGVPAAAVEAWENGVEIPNTPYLVKLAKKYNVSLDSLLMEDAMTDHTEEPREVFDHTDDYRFRIGRANFRISHAQFPYPIIVSAAYLAAGFLFGWWHPAWLLFLTIPLYYTMPDFDNKPVRDALLGFPYPVLVSLVYLPLGIFLGWWHPWWMLYLTIPLYYILVSNMEKT